MSLEEFLIECDSKNIQFLRITSGYCDFFYVNFIKWMSERYMEISPQNLYRCFKYTSFKLRIIAQSSKTYQLQIYNKREFSNFDVLHKLTFQDSKDFK